MSQIAENLRLLDEKITKQTQSFDRDPKDVNLVAVSKRQPPEKIQEALEAGHRLYGENRVQEAYEHWTNHREHYSDLKLHLIGPLQTNKTKEAVALFDVIETLDREKLAKALAKEMEKQDRSLPCFIQVNTGDEPQKAGISPSDLPAFKEFCEGLGLNIIGLMCIPPIDEPPALHFAFLKKLAEENNLDHLSMGMSGDYEKAIALGATYIRVGTAIFGARDT
ncbi:MAG: YggS family pyridoxal phosphate-dependent enzyme [Pseudomonadota bacterium]